MILRIWQPDNEDVDDAEEVTIDVAADEPAWRVDFRVEHAVTEYAEEWHRDCAGECGNSFTLRVLMPDGAEHDYAITVDYSPTFSASRRQKNERAPILIGAPTAQFPLPVFQDSALVFEPRELGDRLELATPREIDLSHCLGCGRFVGGMPCPSCRVVT